MRDLSISTAWDETKALLNQDGKLFASVALALIVLPTVVVGVIDPRLPEEPSGPLWLEIVTFAISLISLAGQLALIRLALAPSVSVGEAIGHGFRRLGPYLVALVILVAGAILLAVPIAIVLSVMGYSDAIVRGSLDASTLPGPVLLVILIYAIALMVLAIRFLLSMPVAAAEQPGPLAILKRSWQLTGGNWLRLFAFLILTLLAAGIVLSLITVAVGSIVALTLGTAEPMSLAALLIALFAAAVTGMFTVLFTVMVTRIYVQLSGRDTVEAAAPR